VEKVKRKTKDKKQNVILSVKNLSVKYGQVLALDDISLQVKEGEIVTLIGPNGAGKSTALNSISGLINRKGGEIKNGIIDYHGQSIRDKLPHDLVEKGISLVPEGRRVFTSMTVLENLEMGFYTQFSVAGSQLLNRLDRVFNLFPVLKERRKQKAGTLSGGEQQMLAVGRALMLEPDLLLLDEPSLGLSPNYVEDVFEKIEEINKDGTTILLVEQNARMSLEYADRGYVFKIGEIFMEGYAKKLLKNDKVRKSFLGEF